jgi:cyclopropane-fatty-acyl-phospholipid synthase
MDAKLQFFRLAEKIRTGSLYIVEPNGTERCFGDPGAPLSARVIVRDNSFFRRVVTGGSLGVGESYVDSQWDVEGGRLADLFGVLFSNRLERQVRAEPLVRIVSGLSRLIHTPRFIKVSKRCISRHYDLSNEFFALMLDSSMTYSCGYQLSPSDSLHDMQQQKYALICDKLKINKGDRILDIGCGWGGMLVFAAKHYGASGVGITLSKRQVEFGRKLLAAEGLDKRVKIHLCDYRQIDGVFDRIVSIGMFEHVGLASYGLFMSKINRCLKTAGRGLLHTIGSTDDPEYRTDPWIDKYIFPGSRLPRLNEIVGAMDQRDFCVAHVENLKIHYAETLSRWQRNFVKNWPLIQRLDASYNDRFKRMWNYYLQVCEAGFRYGNMQVYQILFGNSKSWACPAHLQFSAKTAKMLVDRKLKLPQAV